MSPLTLEVHSRIVGGRPDVPALDTVLLELLEERITVAELIRRTVEEQVRNLIVRRRLDAEDARRALDRQYLTPEEITTQSIRGMVRYPSERSQAIPQIDSQIEVQKAFRGFEGGHYLILVNGHPVERLDEELNFDLDTKINFLRLTPLVGG